MSKQAKEHEMVTPMWIAKLSDAGMSSVDISAAIGKSPSYASMCLKSNQASKTAEIAAEYVWHKKFGLKGKADKTKVCIVVINEQYVPTINHMVEAFNGNLTVCELNK